MLMGVAAAAAAVAAPIAPPGWKLLNDTLLLISFSGRTQELLLRDDMDGRGEGRRGILGRIRRGIWSIWPIWRGQWTSRKIVVDRSRHRDGQRDNRAFEPMLEERSVHRPRLTRFGDV